jgi:hypothetical protein
VGSEFDDASPIWAFFRLSGEALLLRIVGDVWPFKCPTPSIRRSNTSSEARGSRHRTLERPGGLGELSERERTVAPRRDEEVLAPGGGEEPFQAVDAWLDVIGALQVK